jgi:hypothetical protein
MDMDELAPGTIRVKHKLISFLPFVIINEGDFDPEMHTLYEEPGKQPAILVKEPEPEPPTPPPEVDQEPDEDTKPSTSKKAKA